VKRLVFILACLASASLTSLRAQGSAVLYGLMHDTLGQPLRAYVRVVDGGRASVADGHGRYRLTVPAGTTVVRIDRVGFEAVTDTVTLAAGDSLERDYRLHPAAVELPPTIVTAAKRSQFLDQAVTSIALVTDTDVARRAVTTVDEAVGKAPGVQFLNGQVNIRGSSGYVQGLGSRVLLLVDGVPANQGDRGGINWDLVPLEQVERVEIVKGTGSALYGSAALGGVVNVITRDIRPGFHARVRALGGAYANPPSDIWNFRNHTGAQEGLDVTGSYGTDLMRGTLTGGGWHSDGYREQDRRNHWQTGGKAQWLATPETRVTASGSWVSDQYGTPLVWCTRGTCDDRGQAFQPFMIEAAGRGALTRSDKGYLAGTVEHRASEGLGWHARASWGRTHFTDFQPGRDDWGVANRFGGEFRGELHPTGNRVATVGAEGSFSDVRTNIFTGDTNLTSNVIRTHDQREFAAYAEGEQRLGRARLTAGVRTDFIAVDGGGLSTVLSPRIGAVLSTARAGVWRASVGRGFRAPSLAERFVSTTVQAFRVVPNPNLHSETAWSVELGNTATVSSAVRWDAALFWTEAYDLIEPTVDTSRGRIQFQNVARARLAGLDLALTTTPFTAGLTATLSYTFLYARELAHDAIPDRPLAFRPRHLVTLGADYQRGAVSVGGDFRYTSRFERVELYETDPRVAENVLNLRASAASGPWTMRAQVTNALNYIYNLVPRTLEPVRTVSVVLTWTY
jgi:iron complex outermembrane receptor protein